MSEYRDLEWDSDAQNKPGESLQRIKLVTVDEVRLCAALYPAA